MSRALTPRVRSVLGTPHGRRFSHTPAPPPARRLTEAERLAREKALLEQMRDNPWVARRIREGELPAWIRATPTRVEFPEVPARPRPGPRRRRRLRVPVPAPVLDALGYALAVAAGALAHHLGTLLGHLG